jgi:hypothetical protein
MAAHANQGLLAVTVLCRRYGHLQERTPEETSCCVQSGVQNHRSLLSTGHCSVPQQLSLTYPSAWDNYLSGSGRSTDCPLLEVATAWRVRSGILMFSRNECAMQPFWPAKPPKHLRKLATRPIVPAFAEPTGEEKISTQPDKRSPTTR